MKSKKITLILFMMMCFNSNAQLNTLTIEIESLAAAPACTGYCVVGICLWLRCVGVYCTVETTLLVSHRSPDLVVSTYKNSGENMWAEANIISSAIGGSVGGALGLSGGNSDSDTIVSVAGEPQQSNNSLVFSEADIFGGLGSDIFIVDDFGFLTVCDDDTTYLRPYFNSLLDSYSWRNPELELLNPLTYVPIDVGLWGPLRPRIGFIHQADEPKACGVIAQRALHIASRKFQPHVYSNVGGNKSNFLTDQWQMLYPRPSRTCGPMGINTEHSTGLGGAGGKFVWNVWRRYDCCVKNPGAIPIGQVRFPTVPPQCTY